MVWIKRPSVCLKIAGGGEEGKRGPSFLAGCELMLFQACIIDECERLVFDYILTSSGEVEGWTFLDA